MEEKRGSIKRILKRAGIGILTFIIIYAVLSMAASAMIYGLIFKNIPMDGLPFGYSYSDFAVEYPRSEVEFTSGKNILRGYWYGESGDKGLVIVANGVGSDADRHLSEIMYFADDGWQVFSYNGTGVGSSDGDSIIGLSQSRLDLIAAIDFVQGRTELPIVIYGHSSGGYAAASVIGERDIAGAVSVGGFNSPTQTMYGKAKEYIGILADIELPFLMLQHWFVFGGDGYVDAIDAINSSDTPIAVYYGENDKTVTYDLSLYSHRSESTNGNAVFYMTDSGHSDIWLSDDAKEYVRKLTAEYDALDKTESEINSFMETVDYKRANELDEEFMKQMTDFFLESTRKLR